MKGLLEKILPTKMEETSTIEYNLCWWCGELANSGEHKIKRTDLIKVYGKGPYRDDKKLFYYKDDKLIPVQSSKSDVIKFRNALCQDCNNSRSSRIDQDYSVFMDYIMSNYKLLFNNGHIDFELIFGEEWLNKKLNAIRYYVKHMCCQMSDEEFDIPKGVIEFLNGAQMIYPQ